MPSGPTFGAFIAATVLLIMLPGPSMLFLLARGLAGGRRAGAVSALGVESASAVYVVATAFGLTAALAASAVTLSAVRYLGAAYLVYLGVRTILQRDHDLAPTSARGPITGWRNWRNGFLVGISNPKVALFFLAFFPQFVDPAVGPVTVQVLLLGGVFVAIGLAFDLCYGMAGGSVHDLLARRSEAVRRGRVAAGLTYVALGGWTAVGGQSKA